MNELCQFSPKDNHMMSGQEAHLYHCQQQLLGKKKRNRATAEPQGTSL